MLINRSASKNRSVIEESYNFLNKFFHCSSSRMHVMNHNWSARKQRHHLQSAARISRHSALSEDRIRPCGTSSASRHKDTGQCLQVTISFYKHCSIPVPCKNGRVEITVAEGGQNPVARLWVAY